METTAEMKKAIAERKEAVDIKLKRMYEHNKGITSARQIRRAEQHRPE